MDKGHAQADQIEEVKGESGRRASAQGSRESHEFKNDLGNTHPDRAPDTARHQVLDLQTQVLAVPATET